MVLGYSLPYCNKHCVHTQYKQHCDLEVCPRHQKFSLYNILRVWGGLSLFAFVLFGFVAFFFLLLRIYSF